MYRRDLDITQHGVVHTKSVVNIYSHASKWHIARLPPTYAKRCWAMQANLRTLCNAKFGIGKHNVHAPTYKGMEKEFRSTNNVEYEF